MKINIVAVGNLKDSFFLDGCKEYSKRISRFADINEIEIEEEKHEPILKKEAEKILTKLKGFIIVLDIDGKQLTSVELSEKIDKIKLSFNEITFVIGSSTGLDKSVKEKANMLLSMSKMTFPHRMARLMLLEQIYRAYSIMQKLPYHK